MIAVNKFNAQLTMQAFLYFFKKSFWEQKNRLIFAFLFGMDNKPKEIA